MLHTTPRELRRWLRDDDRTVAMLARRHGVPTRGPATRLVAPRRGAVDA